jgi:hypothetical protein
MGKRQTVFARDFGADWPQKSHILQPFAGTPRRKIEKMRSKNVYFFIVGFC